MAKALFMTYNSVGQPGEFQDTIKNNGHEAILIQYPRESPLASSERRPIVEELFSKATSVDVEPEYVVIYVGAKGSEEAIRLASHLPQDKVGFVMCTCNLQAKAEVLQRHIDRPKILMCECGGQLTMGNLVNHFLQTGMVWPN